MRRALLITSCVTSCLLCFSVYAFRVGVFDLHKVLRQDVQVKKIQAQLRKQFLPNGKQIIDGRKKIARDVNLLRDTSAIKAGARAILGQRVLSEQHSLRDLQTTFQRNLLAAQNKALVKILKRVKLVVAQISRKKGLDMVLTQGNVAYNHKSMDITSDVMRALKRTK